MLYRYAGPCSEPKLTQAAAEVRQAVSKMEAALQRHLFASFIELFQNVDRYGVSEVRSITRNNRQQPDCRQSDPRATLQLDRSCIMNSCQNHV